MSLAPTVLTDVRIYFDSLDATGYSNHVELAAKSDTEESTTFGSAGWKERVMTLKDTDANAVVFWQAGDLTQPDDVAWSQLADATAPLTVVPTSGVVGSLAYLTRVVETAYTPIGDIGKLFKANIAWMGNTALARGQIMHPQGTARTATGNGTGIQLGAVTALQRMYANLHVLSMAGTTPSLTVKLQSSVDNTFSAPTDRIVFTAATTLQGQTGAVLGAVTDQWWRVIWTIAGTTPSFLFAVSAGIGPK